MKKEINIAELLKDCPKGMELYSPIFGEVYLDEIRPHLAIVVTTDKEQDDFKEVFLYDGRYGVNGECMLFPSKGKTTWDGFVPPCKFKDGDVIYVEGFRKWVAIFKSCDGNAIYEHVALTSDAILHFSNNIPLLRFVDNPTKIRFATKEEKQKLFDAINKHGYKWNEETKSLDKLVESNEDVDDKIVMSGIYFDRENYADEVELHLGNYEIEVRNGKTYAVFKNQETKISKPIFKVGDKIKHKDIVLTIITVQTNSYIVEDEPYNFGILMFSQQDKWELINEPKFKAGDEIVNIYRKHLNGDSRSWKIYQITNDKYIFTDGSFIYIQDQNNWVLSTDKFDITTLKPFDKVLVRVCDTAKWIGDFYMSYDDTEKEFPYNGIGGIWTQCIPYESNEHLLGTTDDCDEFYKIW